MLVLIVVNGNLLRRHATSTVVRLIHDRGQYLRKVTPKSRRSHRHVTGTSRGIARLEVYLRFSRL